MKGNGGHIKGSPPGGTWLGIWFALAPPLPLLLAWEELGAEPENKKFSTYSNHILN